MCGLTTSESAAATPAADQRVSGQTHEDPAYAASTCSHAPAACVISAMASTGSTDVVEVVPTVATTAATSPSATASAHRSARILNPASAGTLRICMSSSRAALSTDECACSEQTITRRPVACRAAASAAIVEVDAVSSMCPCHCDGSPSRSASQSTTRYSSSVAAGEVRQMNATWLRVAAISSAMIPGGEAVVAKYAKNRGCCQWVTPGSKMSRSARIASNDSASSGGAEGRAARIWPGDADGRTGSSPTRSRYPAAHSSALAPSVRRNVPQSSSGFISARPHRASPQAG